MKIYYYVPPCPECKSRKTGRIIRQPFTNAGYVMEQSIKNGELVRFERTEPIRNAYCASCGHTWPARIEGKLWADAKIEDEKIARGTDVMYAEILKEAELAAKREAAGRKKSWFANLFSFSDKSSLVSDADMYERSSGARHSEPEIVDRRNKGKIEILYADEDLIQKVLNNSVREQ